MNIYYLFCLISIALVTGCTEIPQSAAVPTPTPENYGLYTDQDLQIYADSIDSRIQQALKNNDANQAQVLGIKRQGLIAEFNRRNLKRSPGGESPHHYHYHYRYSHVVKQSGNGVKQPGNGLPGEN